MGLYPRNLNEYLISIGVPRGPLSKAYIYDPVNGNNNNPGTTWEAPMQTLEAAFAKTVANRHDAVIALAGATADTLAAAVAWNKSYTHLIGFGCELPGVGQRCRVVTGGAAAIHDMITFSGDGCIVKNMQFNNEHASGTATGPAIVSGSRNHFENVFFMMPTSQTLASYCLKVTGGENLFKRCTIGQHTLVRGAASFGLWIAKGAGDCQRNKFIDCEVLSWSNVTTHVPINIDADIDVDNFVTFFENLLVDNIVTGGGALAHAIVDGATNVYHQIILRGNCMFVGVGAGIASPVTYVWYGGPAAAALVGAVNPAH